MEVQFEVLIAVVLAMLFSILYFAMEDEKIGAKMMLSILSSISWFSLALTYVVATPTNIGLSWLFLGLGFIFTIVFVTKILENMEIKKQDLSV